MTSGKQTVICLTHTHTCKTAHLWILYTSLQQADMWIIIEFSMNSARRCMSLCMADEVINQSSFPLVVGLDIIPLQTRNRGPSFHKAQPTFKVSAS